METSNLQMEILQRIYYKKSIWELETINGFDSALKSLISKNLLSIMENPKSISSYDPYCNLQLTSRGVAFINGGIHAIDG